MRRVIAIDISILGLSSENVNSNYLCIDIVANSIVSSRSMSGGDKLFIEWAKRWIVKDERVKILICQDGLQLCLDNGLSPDVCQVISSSSAKKFGTIPAYGIRIIEAIFSGFRTRFVQKVVMYSSSDFLTDVLPVVPLRLMHKTALWVCGFYLRCPNPFRGEIQYSIRSLSYYFSQLLTVMLMKKYVDLIFTLTSQDKLYLESMGIDSKKIEVVNGGVDMSRISSVGKISNMSYDGCFVGRFHHQKGIPELIRVWELVCKKMKSARLAIVGWGDEEYTSWIIGEINKRGLNENITLLGFLDGKDKFTVMKSSKVFLFPSNRESWPIVLCEAMASGLGVVAYDLPMISESFKNKGVIRIKLGNIEEFANAVVELLRDKALRDALGKDAQEAVAHYDWANSADEALEHIVSRTIKQKQV